MLHSTPPATVVQFNLRSVFVAMVVFMVVLAVSSPLVLSWSPARQRSFLIVGLLNLAATGICVLLHSGVRRRSERAAGVVVTRVAGRPAKAARMASFFVAILLAATMVFCAYLFALFADDLSIEALFMGEGLWITLMYIGPSVVDSFWLARFSCFVWWDTGPWSVELCENGLIIGGLRVCLYASITDVRWNAHRPDKLEIKRQGRGWWGHMVIPPDQREKVEAIIRDRIAAAQSA